ncbi:MAG: DNA sulfur modification protein DndB [Clostridiales bacterium]|jgi:DNA sulfur modification protein DndB|nr:DNA sulfur modification protein DndB [Clostridiales bacterium]
MGFCYLFPAVRGKQAYRDYYIAMVPLKLLSRLFIQDESYILPEFRAQRKLNEARIPEIKQYILDNRNTYVFSALSASIDGEYKYIPSETSEDVGTLEVPMESVFLLNDGQHRKAAIDAAIAEDATLGEETISIVFFNDCGLERSQQMFTDLNKHAVKTSNSLATLYDSRDPLAMATKSIIDSVEFFRMFTDKEKDILGKNSSNLFTLNNMYTANYKIMRKKDISIADEEFMLTFWRNAANNIVEWDELIHRAISKTDLRENYIITLAIVLKSLGKLGAFFYDNPQSDMVKVLKGLRQVDWRRNNRRNWENRTLRTDGRVMNSEEAALLTCNKIKQLLGIALNPEESAKERHLVRRQDDEQ